MIRTKRIYDPQSPRDGFRVLVDRLWPRGVSKARAKIDLWMKDIAPSHQLRKWFGHDPEKWEVFKKRYRSELKGKRALIRRVKEAHEEHGTVTLLYAAADQRRNNGVALFALLKD